MSTEEKCGPPCIVEFRNPNKNMEWDCLIYLDKACTRPRVFECPHEAGYSLSRALVRLLISGDTTIGPEDFRITPVDAVPETILALDEVTSVEDASAVLNAISRKE